MFLYQKTTGIFGPINAPGGAEQLIMSMMDESLLTPDPAGKPQPTIAEGIPTASADGKTVGFRYVA